MSAYWGSNFQSRGRTRSRREKSPLPITPCDHDSIQPVLSSGRRRMEHPTLRLPKPDFVTSPLKRNIDKTSRLGKRGRTGKSRLGLSGSLWGGDFGNSWYPGDCQDHLACCLSLLAGTPRTGLPEPYGVKIVVGCTAHPLRIWDGYPAPSSCSCRLCRC